jgi:hypothetical protein
MFLRNVGTYLPANHILEGSNHICTLTNVSAHLAKSSTMQLIKITLMDIIFTQEVIALSRRSC